VEHQEETEQKDGRTMKQLVRIDIDVWTSIEPEVKVKKVLRETGRTVFVGNERKSRSGTVIKTAGPFNMSQLDVVFSPKPGTKRVYFISEAEDPAMTLEYRNLVNRMLDEIMEELTAARIRLTKIRANHRPTING